MVDHQQRYVSLVSKIDPIFERIVAIHMIVSVPSLCYAAFFNSESDVRQGTIFYGISSVAYLILRYTISLQYNRFRTPLLIGAVAQLVFCFVFWSRL